MNTYVTITPQWQVHIPIAARKKAGFKTHGRARLEVRKGKIIISPQKNDFMDLAGTFKVKNPIPVEKVRDYIDYSRG
jgi:bifunctional DNA-binding transcriptional regulator/antitoxin component of YhaV-PrlF toxin-antitoxin module